jgi:Double-GTPase 2
MQIPYGWTESESKVVAVVGSKQAGKTNYLTVLMHLLQREFATVAGVTMQQLDAASQERFRKKRQDLFNHRIIAEPTQNINAQHTEDMIRFPFNLRLQWGRQKVGKTLNLAIYDVAGENFDRQEDIERDVRYIARCDAVILLVDPLTLSETRSLLGLDGDYVQESEPQEGLVRLSNVMRAEYGIGIKHKLDSPLAIVLTKFDELKSILPASAVFNQPTMDHGYSDIVSGEISKDVELTMGGWAGGGLPLFAQQQFRTHRWFAVSALGNTVVEEGGIYKVKDEVSPFRVLEPLMWVLHRWGYM